MAAHRIEKNWNLGSYPIIKILNKTQSLLIGFTLYFWCTMMNNSHLPYGVVSLTFFNISMITGFQPYREVSSPCT